MFRFFLFLFIIPKIISSAELNLICTNNYIDVRSLDVKDVFLIINTDNKKIDLGGLSFSQTFLRKPIQIFHGVLPILNYFLILTEKFLELLEDIAVN